jgi:hypothetical protein
MWAWISGSQVVLQRPSSSSAARRIAVSAAFMAAAISSPGRSGTITFW